jgi:hypothetical protein
MKLYTKAVDLIKKNLGERNPILAKIYHNIALICSINVIQTFG